MNEKKTLKEFYPVLSCLFLFLGGQILLFNGLAEIFHHNFIEGILEIALGFIAFDMATHDFNQINRKKGPGD
jgi:hypothetical protein